MKLTTHRYAKALWIAEQMGDPDCAEDVYDVLLGTIKGPEYFVAQVRTYESDYNDDVEKHS